MFTEAYADVEREFEQVFASLFPGGEGRLVLTDPNDMLTTGIEVEARPPGKKVKRLSLLSGGEKSLTAVAMLVAIFRARPSPFYVMDEVEAALDDTNLQRLIGLFEQLRKVAAHCDHPPEADHAGRRRAVRRQHARRRNHHGHLAASARRRYRRPRHRTRVASALMENALVLLVLLVTILVVAEVLARRVITDRLTGRLSEVAATRSWWR